MMFEQARRRLPLTVLLTAMLLAGCGGEQEAHSQAAEPRPVQVLAVQPERFALSSSLPGRVEPMRVAEVRARVAGIVLSRNFDEGADVKAGDVLFRIDPAPFKTALSRAQGELAKADAAVSDAQAIVRRYAPLVKIEAVSQQDSTLPTPRSKARRRRAVRPKPTWKPRS